MWLHLVHYWGRGRPSAPLSDPLTRCREESEESVERKGQNDEDDEGYLYPHKSVVTTGLGQANRLMLVHYRPVAVSKANLK